MSNLLKKNLQLIFFLVCVKNSFRSKPEMDNIVVFEWALLKGLKSKVKPSKAGAYVSHEAGVPLKNFPHGFSPTKGETNG
jgi:hypothetical protein